jgi:hypothetical protein
MVHTTTESYTVSQEVYEDTVLEDARVEESRFEDWVNNEESTMTRVVGTDGEKFAYSSNLYEAADYPRTTDRKPIEDGVKEVASKLEDGEGRSLEDTSLGGAVDKLSP